MDPSNVFAEFTVTSSGGSMLRPSIKCLARYGGMIMPATATEMCMSSEASRFCSSQRGFKELINENRGRPGYIEKGKPRIPRWWHHRWSDDLVCETVYPVLVPVTPDRRCPLQYSWLEEALTSMVNMQFSAPISGMTPSHGSEGNVMRNGVAIPDMSGSAIGTPGAAGTKWKVLDEIYRRVLGPSNTVFYVFPPAGAQLEEGSTMFIPTPLPDMFDRAHKYPEYLDERPEEQPSCPDACDGMVPGGCDAVDSCAPCAPCDPMSDEDECCDSCNPSCG